MTIQEIYDLAIEMATKADPRGVEKVKRVLEKRKKAFKELKEDKKKFFDPETLTNPYSDSRILYGDPKTKVKKLMAGIDADAAEVLIMDRLNQLGKKIDLLISHHPSGHALASLHEVMDMQIDMAAASGVPENVADAIMNNRMNIVQRRISPINHGQAVDAARLLGIPLLSLHTIWDNLGDFFTKNYLTKKKLDTAGDVLEYIKEIPEFVESTRGKAGPFIAAGSASRRAGRIAVTFTGGTNPSKEFYAELAKAGVGTLVEMHVPEDSVEVINKSHMNVIDAGHMAADSIGANIFFDELERRGVEIVPCSGLIRIRRKEKFV